MKAKLPTKQPQNSKLAADDVFGNRLKLPKAIEDELKEQKLVHRFVSVKKIQESGGFHDKGWTVYPLKNGVKNPITGVVDNIYRVGDLVLAVKTQEQHKMHVEHLRSKAEAQNQVVKQNRQEIHDKIKEGKAEKLIQMIDGYEENE